MAQKNAIKSMVHPIGGTPGWVILTAGNANNIATYTGSGAASLPGTNKNERVSINIAKAKDHNNTAQKTENPMVVVEVLVLLYKLPILVLL